MNYIKQMNGFYDHLLKNPMPPKAQSLYLALFHSNNRTDWSEEFIVANVSLQAVCGMTETDILRYRKRLVRESVIKYTKSSGKKAGKYHLVKLYEEKSDGQTDGQSDGQTDGQSGGLSDGPTDGQSDGSSAGKVPTLFYDKQKHKQKPKQKLKLKLKQKPVAREEVKIEAKIKEPTAITTNKAFQEIVQAFNQNIHPITPIEAETLGDWFDQGLSEDLIIRGVKEAVMNNARNMRYINAVLMNWSSKNITTVEALDAHERQRCDGKSNEGGNSYGRESTSESDYVGGYYKSGKKIVIDESKFLYKGGRDDEDLPL